MGQQYLALSLFVILLSFFIILNSFSKYEQGKAQSVLKSLELAFSSKEGGETDKPFARPQPAESTRQGSTVDKLQALFQSHIKTAKIQKNRLGSEMYVQVPLADFETALRFMSASAKEDGEDISGNALVEQFLPTLISLIQASATESPYRMDLFVLLDANPARLRNESPEIFFESSQKAAGLADVMQKAGMDKKLISAGVDQGPVGFLEMVFRRYQPFDPVALLEAEENAEQQKASEPLSQEGIENDG